MRDDIPRSFQDCFAIVRVTMRDGRLLEERCDLPRGMWGLPLTRDERLAKFRDCCEGALPADAMAKVIALVEETRVLMRSSDSAIASFDAASNLSSS